MLRFGQRRLCDAVQDAGSGDGEERLLQGVLRSDHSGFLGCYTGYSAGSKPDRFTLIAQISLGRTFAAGYIPGILMAISMMIVVSIIAHKRNYPTTREKFPSLKEIVKQGITSFWGLFFPFGIILGMRFGMFTPSEGGAVAVLYCIIIGRFVLQETIPERASGSDPA